MSSPEYKRQKLADDVNSVAKMSNVSPKKDCETQTDNITLTAPASNEAYVFDESFQYFQEVASLDGFVDRTLLIEELLEGRPRNAMMFAPSKFGKTVNLNMIRFFCDIEDKLTKTKEDVAKDPTMQELRSNPSKNMKVLLRQFEDKQYEECLILKREKFVIQHFGRHPVVSFNFKDCTARDESEAILACAKCVKKSYKENKYLQESKELQSEDSEYIQTCKEWCSYSKDHLKKLRLEEVMSGLKDLVKSLRIHWGRDPVFLVDEIDKPWAVAVENKLSQSVLRKIGRVVIDVICSILKPEGEELKLQAALVTGISNLSYAGLSPMDNTTKVYFLTDSRFSKYYGLTAQEVDSLVRKFYGSEGDAEIEKIISTIKTHYNGYYQESFSREKKECARYCLFSVLCYIQQRNENKNHTNTIFWNEGGYLTRTLVPVLKKCKDFMSAVQTILHDDFGTIAINYARTVDVVNVLALSHEEMKPNLDESFNYFLQRGYLTFTPDTPEGAVTSATKRYIRIPNLEIKQIFSKMFDSYCHNLPETVLSTFTACGEFFKSLPAELKNPSKDSDEFKNDLEKLRGNLEYIFKSMDCKTEASVCCYILTILKVFAEYEKGQKEYKVQLRNDDKQSHIKIDVWGRHSNFAVIFEVKYNANATSEPEKIGLKSNSPLAAAEDIVKLLPGKEKSEDEPKKSKAGTGKDLEVLKSSRIENYLLVALTVDGDGTTHMLVFRDTADWKNVIQVNPEIHVAKLISTHLKS